MAHVQDRKSSFYSQKQSVRDESLAPQYLESAGDVLVKDLVKKQLNTNVSLKEQLTMAQNFQTGHNLNPDYHRGLTSVEDVKKRMEEENEKRMLSDIDKRGDEKEFMTRHELELSLCEKPNSQISKLYKFAMENAKSKKKMESLEDQIPNHPINNLSKIEQEYFGHLKIGAGGKKEESEDDREESRNDGKNAEGSKSSKNKKKHRKRKRKRGVNNDDGDKTTKKFSKILSPEENSKKIIDSQGKEVSSGRPSLWDVKDMKKWCEKKKEYGCKPQSFYTIKNGKIVKLEGQKVADVT